MSTLFCCCCKTQLTLRAKQHASFVSLRQEGLIAIKHPDFTCLVKLDLYSLYFFSCCALSKCLISGKADKSMW